MFALLDESTPDFVGGVQYILGGVGFDTDKDLLRADARGVLAASRKSPFHWTREGVVARKKMIDLVIAHGGVAVVATSQCKPKGQGAARRRTLTQVAERFVELGVEELLLEAVLEHDPGRDDRPVLAKACGSPPAATYDWANKTEPLLWIADAVWAAVKEHVLGESSAHYNRLVQAGVLLASAPIWV